MIPVLSKSSIINMDPVFISVSSEAVLNESIETLKINRDLSFPPDTGSPQVSLPVCRAGLGSSADSTQAEEIAGLSITVSNENDPSIYQQRQQQTTSTVYLEQSLFYYLTSQATTKKDLGDFIAILLLAFIEDVHDF